MTSSTDRFKKMLPVLLRQHALIDDIAKNSVFSKPSNLQAYHNLLEYIAGNLELDIYTIYTLKKATKSDDLDDIFEIVRFFSGGNSNLFNIKYCYETDSGREKVNITQDEYNNYILTDEVPVDENGSEIEDFEPRYLSFYCLVNYDQ